MLAALVNTLTISYLQISRRPTAPALSNLPTPGPLCRVQRLCPECLLDIGDQIIDVLDTDRQTHEAVVDAKRRANLGWQRRVRHDRRMFGEAFHAAQAFGAYKYAQALKK